MAPRLVLLLCWLCMFLAGVCVADSDLMGYWPLDGALTDDKRPEGCEQIVIKDKEYQLRVDAPGEGGRFAWGLCCGAWRRPAGRGAQLVHLGVRHADRTARRRDCPLLGASSRRSLVGPVVVRGGSEGPDAAPAGCEGSLVLL